MACRSTKCNKAVRQPIMALLFNKVAGEKLMARRSTRRQNRSVTSDMTVNKTAEQAITACRSTRDRSK
jgi:hypothetical protein